MSHATPRLSIVLPLGSANVADRRAFEDTLVSVLENRGPACEIIVAHDGSYDDPFDIGDEVRFAVGDSSGLIDSIAAGCDAAWGRYVHVLAEGCRATPRWCHGPLEQFADADVAAIAPVIADDDEPTGVLGWQSASTDAMQPLVCDVDDAGGMIRSLPTNAVVDLRGGGVYLQASFWRREVLRSLTRACASTDVTTATYAYAKLSQSRGWRCMASRQSLVRVDAPVTTTTERGFSHARKLATLQKHFGDASAIGTVVSAVRCLASEPTESLGKLSCLLRSNDVSGWFEADQVYAAEQLQQARRVA